MTAGRRGSIEVRPTGEGCFVVRVVEGRSATEHEVTVPAGFARTVGAPEVDDQRLVEESFAFLLEHESAESILRRFDLPVISRYFPDYEAEIRRRLGA